MKGRYDFAGLIEGKLKMMTEDLTVCPKCKHPRALTHYSSCGIVNWIACPKCHTFFDHDVETPHDDGLNKEFWENVENDTA